MQVHNLPIGSFSLVVAKEVASVVGMVDESETEVGDGEGSNILKGRKIVRRDGLASWVNFRYERLPNICY